MAQRTMAFFVRVVRSASRAAPPRAIAPALANRSVVVRWVLQFWNKAGAEPASFASHRALTPLETGLQRVGENPRGEPCGKRPWVQGLHRFRVVRRDGSR